MKLRINLGQIKINQKSNLTCNISNNYYYDDDVDNDDDYYYYYTLYSLYVFSVANSLPISTTYRLVTKLSASR